MIYIDTDKVRIEKYDQIEDISSKLITIKYKNNLLSIVGKNMYVRYISKDEIEIKGLIKEFKYD